MSQRKAGFLLESPGLRPLQDVFGFEFVTRRGGRSIRGSEFLDGLYQQRC